MSDPTLPSYRYSLGKQPPRVDCGCVVRGASVRQFPVSKGIAGASMRLQPGCLRELHWHSTAAELGYVVSGACRTTVLSPDGAETDTFGPGDVWSFPRGWGHCIRGIGSSECHFILIFDDGGFAEDHTLSITDWLAHTSPAVVSQSLGLGMEWVAKLPKEEAYVAGGPVPDDPFAPAKPQPKPTLATTHRYPLGAQQPRRVPGGGAQWKVTANEFPISTTLSASVLEIEPGAMRELHWHPHADAKLPPCVVAMEACCGAHHLGRVFAGHGHDVRLMSPEYVRPYVKAQKNDDRDAEGIAEAATRPTMRFVGLKSQEQLDMQTLHRSRDRLVGERTALINQLRAILLERGIVAPQGKRKRKLEQFLVALMDEQDGPGLSPRMIT